LLRVEEKVPNSDRKVMKKVDLAFRELMNWCDKTIANSIAFLIGVVEFVLKLAKWSSYARIVGR
jgi:hypothetical protein